MFLYSRISWSAFVELANSSSKIVCLTFPVFVFHMNSIDLKITIKYNTTQIGMNKRSVLKIRPIVDVIIVSWWRHQVSVFWYYISLSVNSLQYLDIHVNRYDRLSGSCCFFLNWTQRTRVHHFEGNCGSQQSCCDVCIDVTVSSVHKKWEKNAFS